MVDEIPAPAHLNLPADVLVVLQDVSQAHVLSRVEMVAQLQTA